MDSKDAMDSTGSMNPMHSQGGRADRSGDARPPRVFAHVDMDAFFAAIEIRDDPSLRGRPVVVGGRADQRGVVAAASYEARKFGVHSAMPMARALRLCPDLVRIDCTFDKYRTASRLVMEILGTFSPLVEPLSLDEAFIDLTGSECALGEPRAVGERIKRRIHEATDLTASVGIAPVKFVAKIASDLEKPDGLVVVPPSDLISFLHPLPIGRLWGVGPRTQEMLELMGVHTIGDLAQAGVERLERRFGEHGRFLFALASGTDEREVTPDSEAKSYSHEQTFARDQSEADVLESVLLDQAVRVARRLRRDHVHGRVVQLKLRFHDFSTLTRQQSLREPTADADRIYEVGRLLLQRVWGGQPVRLIGVGVAGIGGAVAEVMDLFGRSARAGRKRKLDETIDRLEDRFGRGRVTRARILKREEIEGTGTPGNRDVE